MTDEEIKREYGSLSSTDRNFGFSYVNEEAGVEISGGVEFSLDEKEIGDGYDSPFAIHQRLISVRVEDLTAFGYNPETDEEYEFPSGEVAKLQSYLTKETEKCIQSRL